MTSVLLLPTSRRGWLAIGAVALVLAAAAIVEGGFGALGAELTGYVWLGAALTAAACLLAYPIPFAGLATCLIMGLVWVLIPDMPRGGGSQLIALMFLVGFLAYRLPGRWSAAAWLVAAVVPATSLVIVGGALWEIAFYLLILGAAWLLGVLLQRERRRSAELHRLARELAEEREHRIETALLTERTRIAQELHDAVAHSVSVMTLQVGVVRRRLDALPTEQATLQQAERLGRQSVDELRRIVGLVRPGGPELGPVPSLAQLPELVEQVRAAGTDIELEQDDPLPELTPAAGVSAFRVAQEAVTNALKHAPGAPVRIRVGTEGGWLILTVRDQGPVHSGSVAPGHGLVGMAERVSTFGGRLEYGPATPTGFSIEVRLPVSESARVGEPVG